MIHVVMGDITSFPTQAIVNSANPSLLAGGGVCGAIHSAAGPELEKACRLVGRIEPGQAVVTPAFNLPAEYVIHAVAPRYLDGQRGELEALRRTYEAICKVVAEQEIVHVSIPSLGTGIYRFPLEIASSLAVDVLREKLPANCTATMVCFDQQTVTAYSSALANDDMGGMRIDKLE